jgi:hypothetical protein
MSSSSAIATVSARHGWSEYWAVQSPWVLATVALPRIVFQAAFLVLLAGLAGDRGSMAYAFVGATAYALTLPSFHYAGLRYGTERWQGTLMHLELTRWPAAGIHLVKCWTQVAEGLVYVFVVILVGGAAFGFLDVSWGLLRAGYAYPLMAASLVAFGTAVVVLTPKGRELLALNSATAFILVFAGVVFPTESLPAGAWIATVLPMANGIEALHAGLAGGSMAWGLGREALVASGWLAAAVVLHHVAGQYQRRTGRGSYFQ